MRAVFDEFLDSKGLGRARTDKQRAEAIGMTYVTYRRFKDGTHHLDIEELVNIARFMGITPGDLIQRAQDRLALDSQ